MHQMPDLPPRRDEDEIIDTFEEYEYPEEGEYPEQTGKLQIIAEQAINHPHLSLGCGSLLLSGLADLVFHLDPLWAITGIGASLILGWKGDDLLGALIPGSSEQAKEDAHSAIEQIHGLPVYTDQSTIGKFKRIFRTKDANWEQAGDEEDEEEEDAPISITSPQRRVIKKLPDRTANTNAQELTDNRIIGWFERGIIDDVQLIRLLNHLEKKSKYGNGSGNGSDATDEHKAAPEAAGSTQMETERPIGWDEQKESQLIGAYLACHNQSDSITAIGLSDSQRNRDYARKVLKQNGFLKGK